MCRIGLLTSERVLCFSPLSKDLSLLGTDQIQRFLWFMAHDPIAVFPSLKPKVRPGARALIVAIDALLPVPVRTRN